jgi:hypothetical protein
MFIEPPKSRKCGPIQINDLLSMSMYSSARKMYPRMNVANADILSSTCAAIRRNIGQALLRPEMRPRSNESNYSKGVLTRSARHGCTLE